MSQETCWECGKAYARNQMFDIPVFKNGFTVKWCLNCAMKQLDSTEYQLVDKDYKKPAILDVHTEGVRDEKSEQIETFLKKHKFYEMNKDVWWLK